ncbi:substrate-binding domain-containing protein [Brevibacillus daliensis]|uniref:substrate-binding domain-containing protein n=1 Tax=Brevibacillus daliensis TaxID=2892995 RepID=UPI001E3DFFE4|nr:phosphate/phosphite/phosphonate ABC transporter substrate-binding protein [Brevibacillus daliensis]
MRRLSKLLLMILIICLVSGCSRSISNYQIIFSESESPPAAYLDDTQSPIRVAISGVLSPSHTIMHYRKITDYLGEQLNRPAVLIQRKSYNEISTLMMNGGADIALLSSGAFLTNGQDKGLEAIAMQERMGVPYYYGYLIVNRDSHISDINELREKRVAIADPSSYSSYIFVSKKLAEINETPEHFFESYTYTYSHEKSLKAVMNRVVDAAAVNSLVYEQAKLENPDIINSLQIIEKSEPVGTGPVVISSSLSDEEKNIIKELFMSMHEQPTLKPALKGLFIDRFVPFDSKYYDPYFSNNADKRGQL